MKTKKSPLAFPARHSLTLTFTLSLTFTFTLSLTGCAGPRSALIDGKLVERPTLGYTDHDLFALQHERAWPMNRGASSGLRAYGGRLSGRVCGADVALDSEYHGRYLELSGFLTRARPEDLSALSVHFEARDHHEAREVIGFVANQSEARLFGPPIIDFKYNSQMLVGQVGWRSFDLHRQGDQLVGTVTEIGERRPFVVDGVDELWQMPAPDQVALLPFLMTCAPNHAFERSAAPPDAQLEISFRDKSERTINNQ